MHVRFARLAVQELADAKEWYEAQQKGLGQTFANSVRESALRIARVPLRYQKIWGNATWDSARGFCAVRVSE